MARWRHFLCPRIGIATVFSMSALSLRDLQRHSFETARKTAMEIAERLEYHGVLCAEFFVLEDGVARQRNRAPAS